MNYTPILEFDFTGLGNYTPILEFDFTASLGEVIPTLYGQAWPLYSTSHDPERTTGQLWPLWG